MTSKPDLTATERALIDIESKIWIQKGLKVAAIREQTGLSETRAMQELNRIIETEAALAYDPLTTKRLLRLRAARQRSRPASRRAR